MIGEALAFGGANSRDHADIITETKRLKVIVTKVELREIAMQMLLAAMLIYAAHSTLENQKVAFG